MSIPKLNLINGGWDNEIDIGNLENAKVGWPQEEEIDLDELEQNQETPENDKVEKMAVPEVKEQGWGDDDLSLGELDDVMPESKEEAKEETKQADKEEKKASFELPEQSETNPGGTGGWVDDEIDENPKEEVKALVNPGGWDDEIELDIEEPIKEESKV